MPQRKFIYKRKSIEVRWWSPWSPPQKNPPKTPKQKTNKQNNNYRLTAEDTESIDGVFHMNIHENTLQYTVIPNQSINFTF